jgi:hypothetical protein
MRSERGTVPERTRLQPCAIITTHDHTTSTRQSRSTRPLQCYILYPSSAHQPCVYHRINPIFLLINMYIPSTLSAIGSFPHPRSPGLSVSRFPYSLPISSSHDHDDPFTRNIISGRTTPHSIIPLRIYAFSTFGRLYHVPIQFILIQKVSLGHRGRSARCWGWAEV